MKIPITLNEKKEILDCAPEETLLAVLRRHGLLSPKPGCGMGRCGFCTVLLDGRPVPSCTVPVGIVRGGEVVTLEHFARTDLYKDIMKGFRQAGMHLCGYCTAEKVFLAYELLMNSYRPSPEELRDAAEYLSCTCTDRESFMNGVLYATASKHDREGRKNGR